MKPIQTIQQNKPETLFWGTIAGLLIVSNFHLISEMPFTTYFMASDIFNGEWWRIITHPFAHISWYHLAFDAGAFALLLRSLSESVLKKASIILWLTATSLGYTLLTTPEISTIGLCGLSGVAHGLMVLSGAEMMRSREKSERTIGTVVLIAVLGKCAIEGITGNVMFGNLHFGDIGTPVAACHVGGGLGALLMNFKSLSPVHWKKVLNTDTVYETTLKGERS